MWLPRTRPPALPKLDRASRHGLVPKEGHNRAGCHMGRQKEPVGSMHGGREAAMTLTCLHGGEEPTW